MINTSIIQIEFKVNKFDVLPSGHTLFNCRWLVHISRSTSLDGRGAAKRPTQS